MAVPFSIDSTSRISDNVNYFLIALLFSLLISFSIFIVLFAKWLTMGPKIKNRWFKFMTKINVKQKNKDLIVKKGEVLINESLLSKIDKKINMARNPQELLELKSLKDDYEKSKLKAQEKIKKDEKLKLKKIEEKEEKLKIKKEFKKETKKMKGRKIK